jgi:hypothetical protein
MKQLNWVGVVVAFIVGEGLGMLWYGMLFQERWMALVNPNTAADTTTTMVLGAVVSLVTILGLAWLVRRLNQETFGGGLRTGIVTGVAFGATSVLLDPIYAGRSPELMLIEAGFVIAFFALSGLIVGGVKLPFTVARAA